MLGSVALLVVWGTHVVETERGDPWGVTVDALLWTFASALKVYVLVGLVWLLVRCHRAIEGSRRTAWIAAGLWTLAGVLPLAGLALTRDRWAPLMTTDVSTYYFSGDRWGQLEHRRSWLPAWSSGHVFMAEATLLTALAGIQAGVAFRAGQKPKSSVMLATTLCAVVLIVFATQNPWFESTWDFFHGDIVATALIFDLAFPVALDPYFSLALPLYLSFLFADVLILHLTRGRDLCAPEAGPR